MSPPLERGIVVSVRLANQIRTVSRNRIGQTIGRLTPDETADLNRALRIQLALDAG